MIPPALAPLAAWPTWIVCRLEDSRRRPGKTDKFPVDWRTLTVADAHNPDIWLDYNTAESMAALLGGQYRVGFVFTPYDPFWFIDVDDCATPDGWSPLAVDICQRLAGAAVEVSQSGRGLHLFGSGAVPPLFKCQPNNSMGLYVDRRFVLLGTGAVGDASHDCTAGLADVVARYFTPGPDAASASADWTDGPCEGAAAADVSDEELIRRARAARESAGSAFGGKASFEQLWTADAAALGSAFPDPNRDYDASAADSALAFRLAFWTGKDCERIRRLMGQSALARDKWSREDYMHRTIARAVAAQTQVWTRAAPAGPDGPGGPNTPPPAPTRTDLPASPSRSTARPVTARTLLAPDEQAALFAGHTYILDCHRILGPSGELFAQGPFDGWFGGYQHVLDLENNKVTASAWEAFTSSRAYRFPKVHSGAFRPDRPAGAYWSVDGRDYVNTYVPLNTPRAAGDPAPFLDLLRRILPVERDRAILLAYLAFCLQYPGRKSQWSVLIQGVQGNGKSFINECMAEAIGRRYCHSPKASEITGKFNAWAYGILMVLVEDVFTPSHRSDVIEVLKPMITGSYLEIEAKGQDKRTAEICCNFLLNSNHKDAIRKTKDDRRFAVFYCQQQDEGDLLRDGLTEQYFRELYDWARAGGYAVVNDYLRNYAIPDALNPAVDAQRAPATSSTVEACRASLGAVEQEVLNAIEMDRVGFRGGWVSTHYLDSLLREIGAERSVPRNKRREMLRALGYAPHPGLAATDGRVNNPVAPEGVKSRLYIAAGHADEGIREPARVAEAYSAAQGPDGATSAGGAVTVPDQRPAAVLAFSRR